MHLGHLPLKVRAGAPMVPEYDIRGLTALGSALAARVASFANHAGVSPGEAREPRERNQMKRFVGIMAVAVLAAAMLPACQIVASPLLGGLFTDVTYPGMATNNTVSTDEATTSEAQTILGMVALGDASIDMALEDSSITEISHVDYHAYQIWFFYGRFETYVYGN